MNADPQTWKACWRAGADDFHARRSPRTAAKYSNLYTLRLPWVSIHVRASLHRLTVSSVAPVVCIQAENQ